MIYSLDPAIQLWFWQMKYHLRDCKTALDLGCGESRLCQALSKMSTGVDCWTDASIFHHHFRKTDVLTALSTSEPFDAVIACDVIEHMPRLEGYSLLGWAGRVARKKIIIYTPNGFTEQGENNGNPYQKHLSGWETKDFTDLGFKVYGSLCHLNAHNSVLRGFSAPLVWRQPEKAKQLLAVKTIGDRVES